MNKHGSTTQPAFLSPLPQALSLPDRTTTTVQETLLNSERVIKHDDMQLFTLLLPSGIADG